MFNSKKANVKNGSKRYSFARNAVEIGLIFATLCAVPTPVQAKILFSSQFNSFSDAEVQTAVQNEVAFSEEEIQKGTERVNRLIESYKNKYRPNGMNMRTQLKTQEELDRSSYIINVLKSLDKESLGKCAYTIELLDKGANMDFSDCTKSINFIAINNEIIDCTIDGVNVTAEFKQGEKNLKEQLPILKSKNTESGEIKSENKYYADKFAALILEDHVITEKDLSNLYYVSDGFIVKVLSGINFIANKVNLQCNIESYVDESKVIIVLNGKYLDYNEINADGEWEDKTKIMNEKLEEQRALEFQQLN